MDGFKDFSKQSLKSGFWFCFYLLAQTFSGIFLFILKISTDESFVRKFMTLFAPVYKGDSSYSIEKNYEVLNLFNKLMDNFVDETLLLTGIIIISFAIIRFKSSKNNSLVNDKNSKITKRETLLLLIGGVCFNILISAGIYFFVPKEILVGYSSGVEGITTSDIWLVNLISMGIVSPIVEEIVFRYGILGCFIKINPALAICYQAVLFATVHGSPIQMVYTFILGITFGYLTYKTKSILPSILLHISLNSSTIIVSNMFSNNEFVGLFYSIFVIIISFYIATHFKSNKD